MLTHQIIRISPECGLWNAKVKEQSGIEISQAVSMRWFEDKSAGCCATSSLQVNQSGQLTWSRIKKETFWVPSSCRNRHGHGQRAAFTWKERRRKGCQGEDVMDHFSSCAVHEVSNITFQSSSATSVGHRVQVQWLCSRGSPTRLLRMAYRANQAFYLTSYRYSSTLAWLQYSIHIA